MSPSLFQTVYDLVVERLESLLPDTEFYSPSKNLIIVSLPDGSMSLVWVSEADGLIVVVLGGFDITYDVWFEFVLMFYFAGLKIDSSLFSGAGGVVKIVV